MKMLILKLYCTISFIILYSAIFTISLGYRRTQKSNNNENILNDSSIETTRLMDFQNNEPTKMLTYLFVFPITFTAANKLKSNPSTKIANPNSSNLTTQPSYAVSLLDSIKVPSWLLCMVLKPPPSYCHLLDQIDGKPIMEKSTTICHTLVHTYPGMPPFHFPDCSSPSGVESDITNEKQKMLLQMLCTLIRPVPSWCPNVYLDKTQDFSSTTETCDQVNDLALPGWVLCFVFKPTPPFCKKYDYNNEDPTTCVTVMYTGIPPFAPPYLPVSCDPSPDSRPKDLPWWILCPVIKPLPDWCPDIFRCILTPGLMVTATLPNIATEFPWWKLCEILKPRPIECEHITPPQKKTTMNGSRDQWWMCVIVNPPPQWCNDITIPSTLFPSTIFNSTSNGTLFETNSTLKITTPIVDVHYPLWWMCIILNPPPQWCKAVTFPTDISKTDYPKDIEDGKKEVSIFMYCWWWLCEVFKLWATWCKNLPPPPKNLLDSFPDKLPSNNLIEFPNPPLLIEFP